ncbi:MAG: GNAT family N-acetyltransferase [Gammaproteobacteria bacterium]|nr:GNAT family N-acetyltransferase [Gammaproteobacteria bacterium]
MSLSIRKLEPGDCRVIADAFARIGWESHKPITQYERYLEEQRNDDREVLVAFEDAEFAGYVTIVWQPTYVPFLSEGIPEVQDFNVLPQFRRRKIGTALMDRAEENISARSSIVGIGVGMYADYGNAQRLYVKRGYIPDGRGLTYAGAVVPPLESVVNDDDLVLYFTKRLGT